MPARHGVGGRGERSWALPRSRGAPGSREASKGQQGLGRGPEGRTRLGGEIACLLLDRSRERCRPRGRQRPPRPRDPRGQAVGRQRREEGRDVESPSSDRKGVMAVHGPSAWCVHELFGEQLRALRGDWLPTPVPNPVGAAVRFPNWPTRSALVVVTRSLLPGTEKGTGSKPMAGPSCDNPLKPEGRPSLPWGTRLLTPPPRREQGSRLSPMCTGPASRPRGGRPQHSTNHASDRTERTGVPGSQTGATRASGEHPAPCPPLSSLLQSRPRCLSWPLPCQE